MGEMKKKVKYLGKEMPEWFRNAMAEANRANDTRYKPLSSERIKSLLKAVKEKK